MNTKRVAFGLQPGTNCWSRRADSYDADDAVAIDLKPHRPLLSLQITIMILTYTKTLCTENVLQS